jgi:hypothetical protein
VGWRARFHRDRVRIGPVPVEPGSALESRLHEPPSGGNCEERSELKRSLHSGPDIEARRRAILAGPFDPIHRRGRKHALLCNSNGLLECNRRRHKHPMTALQALSARNPSRAVAPQLGWLREFGPALIYPPIT